VFTVSLFVISYTGGLDINERPFRIYPFFNFLSCSPSVFLLSIIPFGYIIILKKSHRQKMLSSARPMQSSTGSFTALRMTLRAPLSSLLGLIELARKTDDRQEIEQYLSMMKGRCPSPR